MQWKKSPRRKPASREALQTEVAERPPRMVDTRQQWQGRAAHRTFKTMEVVNGKPRVAHTHTRDLVTDGEIQASFTFRAGDFLFPVAYIHPEKRIYGETKDARHTARGWLIYLDAVLRDNEGNPVLVDDCEIEMSGWYLESRLKDAGLGLEPIRLGAMSDASEPTGVRHSLACESHKLRRFIRIETDPGEWPESHNKPTRPGFYDSWRRELARCY